MSEKSDKNKVLCKALKLDQSFLVYDLPAQPYVTLLYVASGKTEVLINGSKFCADSGDTAVINYMESAIVKSNTVSSECICVSVFPDDYIIGGKVEPSLSIISQKTKFQNIIHDASLGEHIKKMLVESRSNDALTEIMLKGRINMIFATVCRSYTQQNEHTTVASNRFEKALGYIGAHFTENLTTAKLSEIVNYEESYFCRRFSQLTGMSLTNYVRMLRMEKARNIFLSGEKDITKTAIDCGYSNLNYFTRCFRSYYGITPSKMISIINNKSGSHM